VKVLVACEYSGRVRDAFRAKGHDAWSCDLLPTEVDGPHIEGSVLDILGGGWDLMIAHPPCTYLCNSGVRWLDERPERLDDMHAAAAFFRALWNAPIEKVAIENPIMHGKALSAVGVPYTQIIHPWQHGHGETKATCLWLRNLPDVVPTNVVSGRQARIHRMSPHGERWKERSRTFEGVAEAMAEQWGGANRRMYQPDMLEMLR
jgi:hypothetical protein